MLKKIGKLVGSTLKILKGMKLQTKESLNSLWKLIGKKKLRRIVEKASKRE